MGNKISTHEPTSSSVKLHTQQVQPVTGNNQHWKRWKKKIRAAHGTMTPQPAKKAEVNQASAPSSPGQIHTPLTRSISFYSGSRQQRFAANLHSSQLQSVPQLLPRRNVSADIKYDEFGGGDGTLRFESVVRVFATIHAPDYGSPWQSQGIENASGSGVSIRTEDGSMRILTAAHCVADQTFLQVQRTGVENPDKYIASVYAVCHECDLALLSVEGDGKFWQDLPPARLLDGVPSHRSLVLVAGFPVGGEELSITEGVVSRIEGQPYSHSRRRLLAITVDAAINTGNSGGPAFNERGELIGIAFQALQGAEASGLIIPPPVIRHFLEGVSVAGPKGYRGFPSAGVRWQHLTNPYLRSHLLLDEDIHGVLVTDVLYGNTCHGTLRRNDVLTHISGDAVANNGTVAYGKFGRIDLDSAFTMFQCGESINLGIVRGGEAETVVVEAKPFSRLVHLPQYDRSPNYFVYCGLVFQPLSIDYMEALHSLVPLNVHLSVSGHQGEDRLHVVILSQVLSDAVNVGYEEHTGEVIEFVNGERVRDLQDLVDKVERCRAGDGGSRSLVKFETVESNVVIVPPPGSPDTAAANERILDRYKIVSDRCVDLRAYSSRSAT